HKRRSTRHKSSSWGLVVLIVVIIIAVGVWYGYTEMTKTQHVFTDIQQSQADIREQNREFEDKLMARMEAMQNQQKQLTDYIQVLRDKNRHLRKDWLLMEAEYLIQLANYRLLFERDINTAISALESADVRLRETGDPGILTVRKVIAEAIQSLKQVPQADLAGLSLTLSAINKEVENLPLATPDPKSKKHEEEAQAQKEKASKNVESWSELPAAIWSDLKSLIVIRDHEAPIQPLLSPDERFFLTENLRLQIEQARLAMLSGQAKVYDERLATAIAWIEKYFDKQSPITKSTVETLEQLKAQSIAPDLPDISNTYQVLHDYRLGIVGEAKQKTVKPKPRSEKPKETDSAGATKPVPTTPAQQQNPASATGAE
ncbi:MAG: uroporphyrinogen-III C-methyltransferase, partial [Thioalkalispiraceae bacterium]